MFEHMQSVHAEHVPHPVEATSFRENPIRNEHVIFFPGGQAMVFDWGLESFAKNLVSVVIAGGVLIAAGVGALLWAETRIKRAKTPVMVQRVLEPKEETDSEGDDEED